VSEQRVLFDVAGPILVPCLEGAAGKHIGPPEGRKFFEENPALAKAKGCYVFGVRAGKGITPVYVGRATKSFGQECFTLHKLEKYNRGLLDYVKGTPVIFLVVLRIRKGATNLKAISELEYYLIQIAFNRNENLLNERRVNRPVWGIPGVVRGGKGKPSRDAGSFVRAMGLLAD